MLRYETFTWSIFIQYGAALNRTLAAAWSLALIALAAGDGLGRAYRSGIRVRRTILPQRRRRRARLPRPVALGKWRWPALAYCAAVAIVSLGLPVCMLVYWTIRGVSAGEPLLLLWRATANSVGISALAAVATVLCAAPIAILGGALSPALFSRWIERLGFVGFALPRHRHRPGPGLPGVAVRSLVVPVHCDADGGLRNAVSAAAAVGSPAGLPGSSQPGA